MTVSSHMTRKDICLWTPKGVHPCLSKGRAFQCRAGRESGHGAATDLA
jgi:hypothetical protein